MKNSVQGKIDLSFKQWTVFGQAGSLGARVRSRAEVVSRNVPGYACFRKTHPREPTVELLVMKIRPVLLQIAQVRYINVQLISNTCSNNNCFNACKNLKRPKKSCKQS